ncbi:hypothetical protein EN873_32090, partial [bacterium M00.F.Ca.ET.230.01.1.1]
FNPRTRVGFDLNLLRFHVLTSVSIHAPVWGATIHQKRHGIWVVVSIHAPVWGATLVLVCR